MPKLVPLLTLLLFACKQSPPPAPPTTVTAEVEPPPPSPPPVTLIVGGSGGLRELDIDGKLLRKLSKKGAQKPRWSSDHKQILFLVPSGKVQYGVSGVAELRRISLAGDDEKVVARLSAPTLCKGGDSPPQLAPQSDDDFVVDGSHACLQLLDRNENMMDYQVSLQIDLATGKVKRHVVHVPDGCELPDGVEKEDPFSCGSPSEPAPQPPADLVKP